MRIGGHHRGFYGYRTAFTGRPAHSSEPALGLSAIGPAADFVRFLLGGRVGAGAAVNVARIDGGTAINIIPGRCVVTWAFRPATDGDVRDVESGVARFLGEAIAGEIGTATEPVAVVPPLSPDPHNCAAAHAARLGGITPPMSLAFGSEAGLFQQAGIPAVVCGPGSIAQAHQPDEWIARSELERAGRFMEAVVSWAAS
jgi:acetylornithine deacetylase